MESVETQLAVVTAQLREIRDAQKLLEEEYWKVGRGPERVDWPGRAGPPGGAHWAGVGENNVIIKG